MAFPPKAAVENIEDKPDSGDGKSPSPKGPPKQSPAPKKQSPYAGSLFGKAGAAQTGESAAGLGSEGSDPSIIGTQGYALIQRGIQMLNLAFPNDPGLSAALTDIMGRLQIIIPQVIAGQNQQLGMGMFPQQQMGMAPGMPPGGGAPGPGGAPPGPPPMMGAPAAPSGGGPIAPPIPSMR